MSHAYPFESLQLVGALVGMGFNAYALMQAHRDASALIASGVNGTRKLVANSNIQQELLRLVVQLLLVIVGITSVVLPPPNPDVPMIFVWGGLITRSVLLLITFLLAFKSWLDVRDRRTLLRLWLAEQDRRRHQVEIDFPDRRVDIRRAEGDATGRRAEDA